MALGEVDLKVRLRGWEDLDRKLRELPYAVENRLARNAVLAGGRLIRKRLIESAPQRTDWKIKRTKGGAIRVPGYLKRNITVRRAKRGANRDKRYLIGPAHRARYGQLVDLGFRHPSGRFVPPTYWMRRAWKRNRMAVLRKMEKNLERGIAREYKRRGMALTWSEPRG